MIVIRNSKTAEAFVNALENAVTAAEKITPRKVSCRDLSKEEIKNFFEQKKMINYMQTNVLDMLEYIGEDNCQSILSSFIRETLIKAFLAPDLRRKAADSTVNPCASAGGAKEILI